MVIYLRLARLAGVLVFVAFIAACIIPAEVPPPVYPSGPPPSGPPTMAGGPIEAGCSYNGGQLPGDVGATFQVACPPGCESTGGLWGTDVYTADSAICRAGIHAGVISPAGGIMSVQLDQGRPAYRGSMRNGIASNDYGSYGKSYFVIAGGAPPPAAGPPGYAPYQPPQSSPPGYGQGPPPPAAGYGQSPPGYPPAGYPPAGYPQQGPPPGYNAGGAQVIEAGCSYNAGEIQDGIGTRHLVACPPGCASTGGLWGTDVYTADSAICRAATHAGLIGPQGGTVAVILEPGRPAYRGSTRNAIQSSDYGNYGKSFRLQPP